MKRLFISWIIMSCISFSVLIGAFYFYGGPKIKEMIETKGSDALGAPIEVGSVNLSLWPPVGIVIKQISFEKKSSNDLKLAIPEADVKLNLKEIINFRLAVNISVIKPDVVYAAEEGGTPPSPEVSQTPPTLTYVVPRLTINNMAVPISADLQISDGWIKYDQGVNHLEVNGLDVEASLPELDQPLSVNAKMISKIDWGMIKNSVPIEFSGSFSFINQILETKDTKLDFAGIKIQIKGSDDLVNQKQDWSADFDIPDLKSVPDFGQVLSVKSLQGSLSGRVRATLLQGLAWAAEGTVDAKKISGTLDFQKGGPPLSGPVALDADVDFLFKNGLSLSKLLVNLDLSGASVAYGNYFSKPGMVPLKISIDAKEASDILNIKQAVLNFASLNAKASGILAYAKGKLSDLDIEIPRTPLTGIEKFFPAIASFPLQGFAELQGSLRGDLKDPNTLALNLDPLDLNHVRSVVKWKSPDGTRMANGPVVIDAHAVLKAQGKNLLSAVLNADADFSGLDLYIKDLFQKHAGSALKLSVNAQKKGDAIQFSKFLFSSAAGNITLNGSIKEPMEPMMDIKMLAPKIDLAALSRLVPMLASYHVGGTFTGKMALIGKYNFTDGIEKSPLNLNGSVDASIPEFSYRSSKTPTSAENSKSVPEAKEAGGHKVGAVAASQSLAPNWPIVRTMNMTVKGKLGRLFFNDLSVGGIDALLHVSGGTAQGSLKVQQIFGGGVYADKFSVPLLTPEPTTTLHGSLSSVEMQQALAWAAPQWKDLARGRVSGTLNMTVPFPSRKDFVEATLVQGDIKIANGYLSTFQFDKYIDDKLSKIPGVGNSRPVKSGGATANIDSIFDFTKSRLNFKTFHVLTPERNELKADGFIKVDRQMDMSGTAYIANAPVLGDVKLANSDSSGRFMLPVHFTGLVTNPDLNLTQETIKKLLANTASYETQKFKKQAQNQVQNQIQQAIQKQGGSIPNSLGDTAKQKLQNLFGN